MSDEKSAPPPPLDLSSLTTDLTRSFQPAWVTEAESGKKPSAFPANWTEEGTRGARPGRTDDAQRPRGGGPDREKRFGHKADSFRDRGPKQGPRKGTGERSGSGRGDQQRSRNERASRGRDQQGRKGQQGRHEAKPAGTPSLAGWEVRFLPEESGVEGLARQIKQSLKAFPLFQLARLVLEKPDRYRLRFVRQGGPELLRITLDQTLWLEEKDALRHLLEHHLEKFYRREVVTGEAPKGNFSCVAQCGMSGVLIGPPNHHDYQSKILRLHAERFAHVPFPVFQSRIRMLRDEESIEKWKQEQATQELFFPLPPKTGKAGVAGASDSTPESDQANRAEALANATEVVEENTTPPAGEFSPVEETPMQENTAPTAESQVSAEPAGIPTSLEQGKPEQVSPAADPETDRSVASPASAEAAATEPADAKEPRALARGEMEKHFRQHHLPRLLRPVGDRCTIPGPAAAMSAPRIVEWLRAEFDKIQRFPLPLANNLSQALQNRGCQIFKGPQNVTYAAPVRPRYLNRQEQPVSDRLAAILDFLERHARAPKTEQWKGLLAITPTLDGAPASAENLTAREHLLATDLTWLLREGFVVDLANIGFQVTPAPRARETPPTATKVAPASPEEEDPSPASGEISREGDAGSEISAEASPTKEYPDRPAHS